jgi:acyl CoA:acetate/3-ketoacid CoA transferase alpha subunit
MKTVSPAEGVAIIPDGATLMIGGFNGCWDTRTIDR